MHRRLSRRGNCAGLLRVGVIAVLVAIGAPAVLAQTVASEEDAAIAQSLAEMLRDARAIVSNNKNRIKDPEIGDKGLTADVVLNQAIETYKKNMGVDPTTIDPASRQGRLLRAMMAAIREVMDANQPAINAKGIGFKAFIPAVFGRLVGEAPGRLRRVDHQDQARRSRLAARPGLHGDGGIGGAPGLSGHGAGILRRVLSDLSRRAERRDGHYRLSQRGRKARRSRRGDQHHLVSVTGGAG